MHTGRKQHKYAIGLDLSNSEQKCTVGAVIQEVHSSNITSTGNLLGGLVKLLSHSSPCVIWGQEQ